MDSTIKNKTMTQNKVLAKKSISILSHETYSVRTDEKFIVNFDNKEWELYLPTVNGEIVCEVGSMATSQLTFHTYPPIIRQSIFNELKAHYNSLRSNNKLKINFYNK